MRITFCDLCDESIPFTDLERGRAVRRKGRSICARCEEAMGTPPESGEGAARENGDRPAATASASAPERREPTPKPSPSPPVVVRTAPSGAGLAVALAVVALLFACGAAVFLLERIDRASRELAGIRSSWNAELERASERLEARIDGRVAGGVSEARDALQEARDVGRRVDEAEEARARSLDELRQEVAQLSERLAANASGPRTGGAGSGEPDTGEIDRLERSVADLHREVLRLSERLRGLEGDDGEGLELPAELEQERPAWWPHVGGLKSNNAGTRWGAVQALGETRDPQVAEHLASMLKDPDIFVRMAAARVLGDLRSVISIPALIEALDDAEPSVREAAVVSLRTVSGQNFAYDPAAVPTERAKRVSAWRDWWEKSRGRLLGGR